MAYTWAVRSSQLGIVLIIGVALGVTAGCVLRLDDDPVCGDGYFDRDQEQCDGDASAIGLCGAGTASCDPVTCELSCCGDGLLQAGEACDGNSARTPPQCEGWSCIQCEVDCPNCGDSELQPGEECDPGLQNLADNPTDCSDLDVPGLGAGNKFLPGGSPYCQDDCTWNLDSCSLCGDGQLAPKIDDQGITIRAEEQCDGVAFHQGWLRDRCTAHCSPSLLCEATCGGACNIVLEPDPTCCIPDDGIWDADGTPCCCQLFPAPDGALCQPQVIEGTGGNAGKNQVQCPKLDDEKASGGDGPSTSPPPSGELR